MKAWVVRQTTSFRSMSTYNLRMISDALSINRNTLDWFSWRMSQKAPDGTTTIQQIQDASYFSFQPNNGTEELSYQQIELPVGCKRGMTQGFDDRCVGIFEGRVFANHGDGACGLDSVDPGQPVEENV